METKIVDKPWGREEIWAEEEGKYLGKFLIINPGGRLSTQYHQVKDETVMCIRGEVYLDRYSSLERETLTTKMQLYKSYHIPALMKHKIYCSEEQGGIVLEVSTHHPDDVVRLSDDYGRTTEN